jgi:hypothetical protein
MRIAQPASSNSAAAVVAPLRPVGITASVIAPVRAAPVYPSSGQPLSRRSQRVKYNENRAKTARVAVVLSLFLVVLAAGLMVGGKAVIDPLLQKAADQREAHRMGDIVFSMRGGMLCRHLAFDNKTAAITEGAVAPCESDVRSKKGAIAQGFAWGAR